ncbi:hypothetical protein Aph01nite_61470 [Acrocarpospora phusangensis]|uniref:Uncharacterized protein n=1 Tax=Acrocarpospora phusangensis TaxID=1070424 RepID=A0A919QKH3_9ACTN|nr:hypothetical protein Aph01nite_61470 [Acrocarpospora phusangensis]
MRPAPAWPHRTAEGHHLLDLAGHRNNVGATAPDHLGAGAFNIWGNSFPAGELPSGRPVLVDGVPFDLPVCGAAAPDNVRADGQFIEVAPARYDWLYVLAAAERRVEDEIAFHFTDGSVDFEPLRLSDFWAAPAVFGESAAVVTEVMHYPLHVQADVPAMLWCQRVPVTRRAVLRAARLPRNPAVHVFAATLREAGLDMAGVADLESAEG